MAYGSKEAAKKHWCRVWFGLLLFSTCGVSLQARTESYSNTVYLPYYRLPRPHESSYRGGKVMPSAKAFDFGYHDPEPFISGNILYSEREVPQFQEYLLAALASGRITQINYFRLLPGKDGDGSIDLTGFYPEHMEYLQRLRRIYGFRLVICVAGGSSRFLPVMKKEALRRQLAQNIIDLAQTWQLDGVDFDWEYPRSKKDMKSYIALIKEVQAGLRQGKDEAEAQNYRVSVAISRLQAALTTELFQAVDTINFMAYDFTPRHSTMEDAREMVEYLVARFAIPTRKIFLGLPFYGKQIKTGRRKAKTYRRLAQESNLASEDNEAKGYYFNGQDMIQQKFNLAEDEDLGGIMIWEIGQDSEDHRSLLKILPRQK
ncbi:glycoside hydrolase family 18 protein [Candidatus Haliotispira prima]|uniref:chitinase n=1 Tax=Candidatus Haliotispira prima TaxID=3034016 RepID=A0ABY8MHW6_9SPIO|nr:glycoside hydrolase family 18 protein [Candidatus Haliotispira prima]